MSRKRRIAVVGSTSVDLTTFSDTFPRPGASGTLGNIERRLEFHATGRYSVEYRHPMA
ncbi:MAG: hypothetical protein ACHQT6_01455 [Candidatus Acidiferrales bacterium]